jgi:hypothetical protein
MCFVWISEQTAIISLYSINWLVFIIVTECLLRGTDWVFKYRLTLVFEWPCHGSVVSRWVRSQVSPCEICGGQSGTVTGFSPSTTVSPSVPFHQCSTLICILILLLSDGLPGEEWEPKSSVFFAIREALNSNFSHFFVVGGDFERFTDRILTLPRRIQNTERLH